MKNHLKRNMLTLLTMTMFLLALAQAPLPFDTGSFGLPDIALTARAAGTATFDEENRVLYLSGNVVKADMRAFANNDNVKYVIAIDKTKLKF